ncbi:hypothetical protein ACFFRR_004917 [Megaselia abdita]
MEKEEIIIEHCKLIITNNASRNLAANKAGDPASDKSPHYTQIIAALAVSLGPLAAGLGKGYTSPAIASLQEVHIGLKNNQTQLTASEQEASWIASLSLLGALFGGIFGGAVMQFGRRKILRLISLPYSLAWIVTIFAESVITLFITAFVAGFCCSVVSMITQVYISEISSPGIRGFLSAIQKISGQFGILISYILGAYLDWRQLAMVVSIAPLMLFVTVIYIPETPSFLVLKGRMEDAFRSLQWLRGPHKNVNIELETIKLNIQSTMSSHQDNNLPSYDNKKETFIFFKSFSKCLKNIKKSAEDKRFHKPLIIVGGLIIFQRFTGSHSFGFYAISVFRKTFIGMNPHLAAISVAFVQLLASLLSGILIDKVGRIPLLITSSVFMSLALASFGSYSYYNQNISNRLLEVHTSAYETEIITPNTDWIPLLCVLILSIAFSLGIYPITSLLVGELFPLEFRAIGSSLTTSWSYLCSFLSVKTFQDFQDVFGLHGAFWLYACISCLGLLFIVLRVPETKGKDLDEMDPKFIEAMTINR